MALQTLPNDDGTFLVSGRKEPRTGGVILARGDRERIDAIIAEDPFTEAEAVRYTVTGFSPTTTATALDFLRKD